LQVIHLDIKPATQPSSPLCVLLQEKHSTPCARHRDN